MLDSAHKARPIRHKPARVQSETELILGSTAGAAEKRKHIRAKWRPFYDLLVKQRDELANVLGQLAREALELNPKPLDDEPAENGTTVYHGDELRGEATFYQATLAEVTDAIARVENGTYGVCEATGRPIPERRLKAIPWTRFTLEAQRKMEARGEAIKPTIGPLGNMRERIAAEPDDGEGEEPPPTGGEAG